MISRSWYQKRGIAQTEPVINNPKYLMGKPLAVGDRNLLSGTPFEAY